MTRRALALVLFCLLPAAAIGCGDDAGSTEDADTAALDADAGEDAWADTVTAPDGVVADTASQDTVLADSSADDTSEESDTADTEGPDTSVADTELPDTTVADTELPDTTVADTETPDTIVADTEIPDTIVADTELPDTTVADTELPDTTVADTELPDTTVADTEIPDTTVADTSLMDSGPIDTSADDTVEADTLVQDTVVADTTTPDPDPVPRAWTFTSFGGEQDAIEGLREVGGELWVTGLGTRLWNYRDARWRPLEESPYHHNHDVCGAGADDLWASSSYGVVAHWDGAAWGTPKGMDTSPVILHCDGARVTAVPTLGDVSWHYDGASWSSASVAEVSTNPRDLAGAWDDLYGAVGASDTTLWRFDGSAWAPDETAGDGTYIAIEALDDGSLCAVGYDSAVVCRAPSATWQTLPGPAGALLLRHVAGFGVDDLWVATLDGAVLHWDGAAWTELSGTFATTLVVVDGVLYRGDVDGRVFAREGTGWRNLSRKRREWLSQSSSGALYRSGGRAGLDRYDGAAWTAMGQPFDWDAVGTVLAIGDDDLWLAGATPDQPDDTSTVHHWDGATWTAYVLPTPRGYDDVIDGFWARSSAEVYAWSGEGDVLRYDGAAWQSLNGLVTVRPRFVAGLGADVWVGGPLLSDSLSTFGLDVLAGTAPWTSEPTGISYVIEMDAAGTTGWVVNGAADVWQLSGGAWTLSTAVPADDAPSVLAASDSDVWVSGSEQHNWDGAAWSNPGPGFNVTELVGAGDDVHGLHAHGGHVRWDGAVWSQVPEVTVSAVVSPTAAAVAEDGVVYTAGAVGVLRDDGVTATFERAERLGYISHLFTQGAEAAWGLGQSPEGSADVPTMWQREGDVWRRIVGPNTGSISYDLVSGQAVGDEVWVSNARPVNNLWRYADGQWTQMILGEPDTWFQMAPMHGGRIMALAHERNVTPEECQIWHHDGVDWSWIATVPPVGIACNAATDVWAESTTNVWLMDADGDLARFDGSGWTTDQSTFLSGGQLAGPSEDDLWLRRGNTLSRWDPAQSVWREESFAAGKGLTVLAGRPFGDMVLGGGGFTAIYRPE